MSDIVLTAPLKGWVVALAEAPDPVFAGRLLGDGVAIDPTGRGLHAPCDGEVVSVHAARHAVAMRTPEGAELLMHVGVDTVALGGAGFTAHVAAGQAVKRGDPLIGFDLDALLDQVPAVMTPILLTNPDAFEIVSRRIDCAIEVGEPLMALRAKASAITDKVITSGGEVRRRVVVPLAHGLHARPAARVTECARGFAADLRLIKGDQSAAARGAVGMLALGIGHGDEIEIVGVGEDAEAAVAAVTALIEGGMDEPSATEAAPPASPPPVALEPGAIGGVMAAPGLAVGRAVWLRAVDLTVNERAEGEASQERDGLDAAIRAVRARLRQAADHGGAAAAIAAAHLALLDDPEAMDAARRRIAGGSSASHAWRMEMRVQAEALRGLADRRLAERADDLLDLERQVLSALAGEAEPMAFRFPPDSIVLAEDLLPSQLMAFDRTAVAGLCTVRGGPTSHVAILAAGMGLPALAAMGEALKAVRDGDHVILDASAGALVLGPSEVRLAEARADVDRRAGFRGASLKAAQAAAVTTDGRAIEVFANLGSVEDARLAVANGAEGCGLLRTEFLFLERAAAPGEDEQAASYQAIADALQGRPLIVRLLDIGGDKPAPYLPMAPEENPALGLRGIRVGLAYPQVLADQLRAILRVRPIGQCRIMVPMIASVGELLQVRAALDRARADLGMDQTVPLGIMVETPAAIAGIHRLAPHADFLSIGTNDLTQYALAMDRGNPAVAAGIDALHPAILNLIGQTCRGGDAHGRWTGVCGGLASDPLGAPILIGLGVTELSAVPAIVPEIKATVRAVAYDDCRRLAQAALDCDSAAEVRQLATRFLQGVLR